MHVDDNAAKQPQLINHQKQFILRRADDEREILIVNQKKELSLLDIT